MEGWDRLLIQVQLLKVSQLEHRQHTQDGKWPVPV